MNGLGFKPHAFSITINARLRPNLRNLIKWLAHVFEQKPSLILWTVREVLDKKTTFNDAYDYLSTVPQIADSYYILGGLKSEQAVIIVRNSTSVVQVKSLDNDDWFLLQTNYDPGKTSFLFGQPTSARRKLHEKAHFQFNHTLQTAPSANLKTNTQQKRLFTSIIMSLTTNEYYSFTQNCPDPCWFI